MFRSRQTGVPTPKALRPGRRHQDHSCVNQLDHLPDLTNSANQALRPPDHGRRCRRIIISDLILVDKSNRSAARRIAKYVAFDALILSANLGK